MDKNYQLGLLYLIHLLINADGVAHQNELDALRKIKMKENIPDATFHEFEATTKTRTEREIYQRGLDHLNHCSEVEKLKAFATIYRLSEVDGLVHTTEIRLLLYSLQPAGLEFNDVVNYAKTNPSIF